MRTAGDIDWRRLALRVHEWLGLTTGLVVFVVSVTGCLWVFQEEIEGWLTPDRTVPVEDGPVVAASRARDLALEVLPDRHVHGTLYGAPGDPVEVIFYEADPEFYQSVFLHPYTGEVLGVEDHFSGFFHFVLEGHMHLWLPEAVGEHIVGTSVLLFLVMLGTGLVLWWPRTGNKRQRFGFLWTPRTRWRRKNFDLHAIVGFYALLLAGTLAFTGSIMAYDWFYYIVYKGMGGDSTPRFVIPDGSRLAADNDPAALPLDRLVPQLREAQPEALSFELHYPSSDTASIYVEVTRRAGVYYSSDYRFFDQNTLAEIDTPSIYGTYADAGFADTMMRMNYDIHVGAIGGLPGKILAFMASLATATLPVTGFLLWWGRRRRAPASAQNGATRQRDADSLDEALAASQLS